MPTNMPSLEWQLVRQAYMKGWRMGASGQTDCPSEDSQLQEGWRDGREAYDKAKDWAYLHALARTQEEEGRDASV